MESDGPVRGKSTRCCLSRGVKTVVESRNDFPLERRTRLQHGSKVKVEVPCSNVPDSSECVSNIIRFTGTSSITCLLAYLLSTAYRLDVRLLHSGYFSPAGTENIVKSRSRIEVFYIYIEVHGTVLYR